MTAPHAPAGTRDWLRGDWMQTYTGRAFYPLDPRPDDIDIADIAHGLSLLCRYGGQCREFYSVAEHSVLMSQAVSRENALWALLHDATEAYMGDLIRPLKRAMPTYAEAEEHLLAMICLRFGLTYPCPDEVKAADTRILRDERAALLGPSPQPWLAVEEVEPLGVEIRAWAPPDAECFYLDRFHQLVGRCCESHTEPRCCDPEDCGPCCENCPTCPAVARMKELAHG